MAKKGVSMNFQRNHTLLMKRIPLHYQKRLINSSNGSFNTTFMTGIYKNKIKTLLKNNKILAISLQNDRSKKEELLEENKANANIIMFSRLKLASLSENLKQVVTVLDETLSLLQMHSSVCSTKFTPKHTVCREEFKEQVQNVLMDSIPEEPESPEKHSYMADPDKKQSDISSPMFQVEMLQKSDKPSEKLTNSKKTLKPCNFENNSVHNCNEADVSAINYTANNEHCTVNTTVNNFDKSSPVKKTVAKDKKISNRNKNFTSKSNKIRAETNLATNKKGSKVTKKGVSAAAKKVSYIKEGKDISENSISSKNNQQQSELHNGIRKSDGIQMPQNKKKNESKTHNVENVLKIKVSPSKLHGNIVNNINFRSDWGKENVSPYKKHKLTTRNFKSLDTFKVEPSVTKRKHSSNSALQSLSSRFNIENFKDKDKTSQIDDIVTIKQKSAELLVDNSERCDTSRSYLQDLSLHRQEMVRNLAENTFLVTAEVHNSPLSLKTDKLMRPKVECGLLKEPIVLVKDIFQSGKSFCKSISNPAFDEVPLTEQLLVHCSSLKMIPEESNHSQDNSTGNSSNQALEEAPKIKLKNNDEPSLSIEEDIKQNLQEEKRKMRKRSTSINYKEPSTNVKLRRIT